MLRNTSRSRWLAHVYTYIFIGTLRPLVDDSFDAARPPPPDITLAQEERIVVHDHKDGSASVAEQDMLAR
jgi:hypothetical protein